MPANNRERVLTIKEVAEMFHRKECTIRRRLEQRKLPGHKMGSSWYVLESELIEAIKKA